MTTNGFHHPDGDARAKSLIAALETVGVGLEEALDVIELPLDDPRASSVRSRLQDHPRLVRELDEMRSDRSSLAAIGRASAPSVLDGVIEAARAQSEREALLSLERTDPAMDTPPVSRVIPQRTRWHDRVRIGPRRSPVLFWSFATAAGLTLVSGLALMTASRLGVLADAPQRIADTRGNGAAGGEGVVDETVEERSLAQVPDAKAEAAEPPTTLVALDGVDAAASAFESGRLVLVVSGDASSLEGLTRSDGLWTLETSAPAITVSSIPLGEFAPDVPGVPVFAGDAEQSSVVAVERTESVPEPSVALARITLGRTGLVALVAQFERAGFSVEFVEVADEVVAPIDLSPDAVGWWGRPPSTWPDRAPVPIVVRSTSD